MNSILFRHLNPGPAHRRAAQLLSAAWGVRVSFGAKPEAQTWSDSGWLDAPERVEPPFEDALAWIVWRTDYWEHTLELDAHGRPMGRTASRDLMRPEAELRARALANDFGVALPVQGQPNPVLVVDIDHLYAYRGRGWRSFVGGGLRDLLRGDWRAVSERAFGPDPFYSSAFWADWSARHPECALQFFALLAAEPGTYDRGVRPDSDAVHAALKQLGLRFDLGAHLSYGSHDRQGGFRKEVRYLDSILGVPTLRQRFHFLRHAGSPQSVQALTELGLAEDWSNEFADVPGFRSGWASPFPANDQLWMVPVAVMDQNLIHLAPREVAETLHALERGAWSVGSPLRLGTHWRIFGPRPSAERHAKDFTPWREGLELWLNQRHA